jgi:hypothetical protein
MSVTGSISRRGKTWSIRGTVTERGTDRPASTARADSGPRQTRRGGSPN